MSEENINLAAPIHAATKQGKAVAAREVFMDGDQENLQQIGEKTHQLENAVKDITATGGASTANAVSYINSTSGMTAVTVQGAIDELASKNKTQDATIAAKAEKSDVQSSVSELKTKNTLQDAEIDKKANTADVTSQMKTEQSRVNTELDKKFNKESISQESGDAEDKVMSQKAVSTKLRDILNRYTLLDKESKLNNLAPNSFSFIPTANQTVIDIPIIGGRKYYVNAQYKGLDGKEAFIYESSNGNSFSFITSYIYGKAKLISIKEDSIILRIGVNADQIQEGAVFYVQICDSKKFSLSDQAERTAIKDEMFYLDNNYKLSDRIFHGYDFTNHKKAMFYGDSITYGLDYGENRETIQNKQNWVNVFAELTGLRVTNHGVSGTTLSQMLTNFKYYGARLYDYIFIAGGINDYHTNKTDEETRNTMREWCEYLKNNYPHAIVTFITPINEATRLYRKDLEEGLNDIRRIITEVAVQYSFNVIQGSSFPFPSERGTLANEVFSDDLHPNTLGYRIYAETLYSKVMAYNKDFEKIDENLSKRVHFLENRAKCDIQSINENGVSFVTDGNGNSAMWWDAENGLAVNKVDYDTTEKIRSRYIKNLSDWSSLGTGMFIHWGVYSVLEGHYSGQNISGETIDYTSKSIAEWILRNAKIPDNTYKAYQSQFTASKWNADDIAKMAYNAGMKYIVITAKHHDGFVMYDSDFASWCTKTSAARGTLLDELKKSCEKFGLKFCLYFSQTTDWTAEGGFHQDYKNSNGIDPYTEEQHMRYINETISVIKEMINRFDPYELWYDMPTDSENIAADKYLELQLADYPQVIVNNRLFKDNHAGDIAIGEGGYYNGSREYAENCFTTNGSWGYNRDYDTEEKQEKISTIIEKFIIESRSRNQNVLINIGPKGDGSVSDLTKKRLDELSKFVSKYGTFENTRSPFEKTFPNWGRILVKDGNLLKCYVFNNSTSIKIQGINTTFIRNVHVYDIEDSESINNYTVMGEDEIAIHNIPVSKDGVPAVVDILFDNNIVGGEYSNIINDDDNVLNAMSFYPKGWHFLLGYGTENYSFGGWTQNGNIETTFKYTGNSKDSTIVVKNNMGSGTVVFHLTINDLNTGTEKTYEEDGSNSFANVSLINNHVYKITISKTGSGWKNVSNIQIL